jgi:hypothetical protein
MWTYVGREWGPAIPVTVLAPRAEGAACERSWDQGLTLMRASQSARLAPRPDGSSEDRRE